MKVKNNGQAMATIGKHTIFPNETVEIDDVYKKNAVVELLIKRGEMLEVVDDGDKKSAKANLSKDKDKDKDKDKKGKDDDAPKDDGSGTPDKDESGNPLALK